MGVRSRTSSLFRGSPSWAKPSKVTSAVGVVVGLLTLLFKPTYDGNGNNVQWVNRLQFGIQQYQQSKNPADLLASDSSGNNILSIAAIQIEANAPGSIATIAGYSIVAGIERWFGM